jgi:two-component system, NtrC family, sensor kinase
MKRTVVAISLAVAAVALLAVLVLQSRGIAIGTHVAHHEALAEIERIADDHVRLVASLRASWESRSVPGEGSRALADRLAEGPARLEHAMPALRAGASQHSRVQNSRQGFASTVERAATVAVELAADQDAYSRSLAAVRESGPELVQRLRDVRLDNTATDLFALIATTIEFATGDASTAPTELRRLLATVQRDQRIDANMPTEMRQLGAEIENLLRLKPLIMSRLVQLEGTAVRQSATSLAQASQDLYAVAVSTADQARTTLAVYAVLLLAAAAFAGLRLHQSYRALNFANGELAELNESLEQRVSERTRELRNALANLKESQVQLVQAEKMSSLGQLVAGISHEINTPLLYLTNNAELIQERVALLRQFTERCEAAFSIRPEQFADRAQYQQEFISALKTLKSKLREEDIHASLEEAEQLARDSIEGLGQLTEIAQSLKDFSRLDRAPSASFQVNAGIEKTLLIAQNLIKHKATVHKVLGDLPEIECSPSQINQVFLNLVTNAAQAIESQGDIVITTELRDEAHVAITVADNGCGIAPEHLDRIRDPFFTTKEVGQGTGLGLSIVDEIIRNHGGTLEIRSEPGRGSAFTVVLPIRAPQPASDRDAALQEADVDTLLSAEPAPPTLAEAV